jgi:hypothetical protein
MRYEVTIQIERTRHLPGWWDRAFLVLARRLPSNVTGLSVTGWTADGEEAMHAELMSGGVVGPRPADYTGEVREIR